MAKAAKKFTTESGIVLSLKRFNPGLISVVNSSVQVPKRPTYQTKTFSGRVEEHPMDEVVAAESTENMSKWVAWKDATAEADNERTQKVLNAMLLAGVEVELPADDSWLDDYALLEIPIPEDKRQLKLMYLQTILTPDDLVKLMGEIQDVVGVTEESVKNAESAFPDQVRNGE